MLQQTTFSDQWRNTTGFPDEMTQAELHDAIETYCEHVIGTEYSDVFDSISINDIDTIEISPQLKRAAGAIKYQQTQLGQNEITLTIAFNAYREWGWSDQFRAVIRHELVHVLQIVETDDADHGDRFQRLASKLETSKHCETFCEYNYSFHCSNCGELCAGRYEKTKLVEDYTEYLSACCQASLELRENES